MSTFNNYDDNNDVLYNNQPVSANRFDNNMYNDEFRPDAYSASATPMTNPYSNQINASHIPSRRTSTYLPQTLCSDGMPISTYLAPNANVCRNNCINNDNCKSWAFNNGNRLCSFKNQATPCRPNPVYTSGIVSENNLPIGYGTRLSTTLNDVSFFGNVPNRTMRSPNAAACKNSCINDRQCNQWSYDPAFNKCSINYGQAQIVSPNNGASSGQIYIKRGAPVIHPNRPVY